MAKIVRFPLVMADGTEVRTLEELQKHFDLTSVVSYFKDGKLVTWLEHRYLKSEAEAVKMLDESAPDFQKKLCEALGVEFAGEAANLEAIMLRQERLKKLREYTDNDTFIQNIDYVAFDQDEVYDLLDEGTKKIYLCGESFTVPASQMGLTYIGVNHPKVRIDGKLPDDLNELGITLEGVECDTNIQKKKFAAERSDAPAQEAASPVDWHSEKITGDVVDRICYVHGWGPDILKRYQTNLIETTDFVFCNKYEDYERWGQDEDYCIYNKRTGEEKRIKFESFAFGSNFHRFNYAVEPGKNTAYYQRDGYLLAFDFTTLEKPVKLFKIPGYHPENVTFSANNRHIAFRAGDNKFYVYDIEAGSLTRVPEQKNGWSIYSDVDGAYYGTDSYPNYELKFYDYKTKKTSVVCTLDCDIHQILHVEEATRFYVVCSSNTSDYCGIIDIRKQHGKKTTGKSLIETIKTPFLSTFDVMNLTYNNLNGHVHAYHDGIAFVDDDGQIVFVRYKDDAIIKLAPDAAVHEYDRGGLFRKASSSTNPVEFFRVGDWICYPPEGNTDQFSRVSLHEPGCVELMSEFDNGLDINFDFTAKENEVMKLRRQMPEIVL